MAQVTIGTVEYDSYVSVADAGTYLAADALHAESWAAATADAQGRALVTATRLLAPLPWLETPSLEDPPQALKDATALFAAEINAKPALASGAGTGSNVKKVEAKGTGVEFFKATSSLMGGLTLGVWNLIRGLLGSSIDAGSAAAIVHGTDFCSRFDTTDYGLHSGWN